METPLLPIFFSIVIPTHNRPDLLKRALNSVYAQSFGNFEVIVINDGSTQDYTSALIPYAEKIYLINNHSALGAATARNIGVNAARADWIVFLDDDDEFYPEFLHNLYWRLLRAEPDVGFSWASVKHQLYNIDGQPQGVTFTYFDSNYYSQGELYAQAMRVGCGYGFAVKKSCFLAVGGFDSSYRVGEDTELIFKLISHSYQPLVCSDVGVIVHEHNNNRLTPNYEEHAKTGVYDRLIHSHESYIAIYPQLLSRFMGWAATVYYMAGNFSRGNEILREMLKMKPTSLMVWKKYLEILVRRYLIKKELKKTT
jgi:glycosyltransferase involved in cell wall biosynthesis